ncbi:hypothetical protein WN093_14585 [Gammaproteobacteria bacterium AS21]|jgi:hypothetical protein
MGQTETALLVISIVVVLGCIAYAIQSIEERKRARKIKIMRLKSQIQNALAIYKNLPDFFMSAELHDFMHQFLLRKWRELHTILQTEESVRACKNFQEKAKNRVVNLTPPQGSMTVYQDDGQVYHALGILKETIDWLSDLRERKQMSEHAFNELGWQTKDAFERVSCDIQVLEALETQRLHGEKAGFHKFKSALKSLNNLNQSESLDSQIFSIHKHMEQLRDEITRQEAAIAADKLRREQEELDL